jgi:D-alanine transaminase
MFTDNWVHLNGQLIPFEKASLPLSDRGILFGDGVYEVIAVYQGRARALHRHLDRLEQSLSAILLRSPLTKEGWERAIYTCLEKNNLQNRDAVVYIQVTRGSSIPRDFDFSEDAIAHYFIQTRAFDFADRNQLKQGCKAISHEDIRRVDCFIKSTCLQTSSLLKHQAAIAGAQECLLHRDGFLTEGSTSNVFMIQDDVVYTPPLSRSILPGVTRQLVIDLCLDYHIEILEKPIAFKDLYQADNLFITSTTRTLKPISQLDDAMIGNKEAGPICLKLIDAYLKKMETWHEQE